RLRPVACSVDGTPGGGGRLADRITRAEALVLQRAHSGPNTNRCDEPRASGDAVTVRRMDCLFEAEVFEHRQALVGRLDDSEVVAVRARDEEWREHERGPDAAAAE